MTKSMLVLAAVCMIALASVPPAGAFGLEFAAGGWAQDPSGTLGYKAVAPGDLLDVNDDLNYDEQFRGTARLSVDMPLFLPNIALMATAMEFSATGQKTAGFKFGDVVFNPGPFDSETILNNLDIGLYYGLPFIETATAGTLALDLGVNLRVYDYDVSIRQASSGLNESDDGTVPIPMVYLAARFKPIERLTVEAEARGISYSGNDVYSLIGRIKIQIVGPLFAAGGYRYEKAKVDEADVLADIEISGPFLEAGFAF